MEDLRKIIQDMAAGVNPSDSSLAAIISSSDYDEELAALAYEKKKEKFGDAILKRGLVEFTNCCRNDCLYCGLRRSNAKVMRYRLSEDEIIETCANGYELGFRRFVLQGGEDLSFTDESMCRIISGIKHLHPDCSVTLSIGEKDYKSYKAYFNAGADRFLLRHETADPSHYSRLHPSDMSLQRRKECLYSLKEIGFQVGSGFMVGSPFQTVDNLVADIRFLQELKPFMIGIGPFIHHKDTPFAGYDNGSPQLTVKLVSILRLLFPEARIPATTSLHVIGPQWREKALCSGANVIMPNITPLKVRKKYELYDGKNKVE